jgi:hypothetical protein
MSVSKIEILDKEISRKQFLQIIAGSGLTLFGFSNLLAYIRAIVERQPAAAQASADAGHGFGTRKFGV